MSDQACPHCGGARFTGVSEPCLECNPRGEGWARYVARTIHQQARLLDEAHALILELQMQQGSAFAATRLADRAHQWCAEHEVHVMRDRGA